MKKIILLLAIMLAPFFASAQTSEYYIYNIVTFYQYSVNSYVID